MGRRKNYTFTFPVLNDEDPTNKVISLGKKITIIGFRAQFHNQNKNEIVHWSCFVQQ